MPANLKDIQEALEFVCAGGGEHQAFLCKQSSNLYREAARPGLRPLIPAQQLRRRLAIFQRRGAYAKFKNRGSSQSLRLFLHFCIACINSVSSLKTLAGSDGK
jgi:hypothetical protein